MASGEMLNLGFGFFNCRMRILTVLIVCGFSVRTTGIMTVSDVISAKCRERRHGNASCKDAGDQH